MSGGSGLWVFINQPLIKMINMRTAVWDGAFFFGSMGLVLLMGFAGVYSGKAQENNTRSLKAAALSGAPVTLDQLPQSKRASTRASFASGTAPLPDGVSEITFPGIFKPVGGRGLEYTDFIRRLNGRKVCLKGYMVKQAVSQPGLFLLSPVPVQLEEDEMGLADDMPSTVVHIHAAPSFLPKAFLSGRLLLTGRLEIGTQEESDGRLSNLRIFLDRPVAVLPEISASPAPASQPAR